MPLNRDDKQWIQSKIHDEIELRQSQETKNTGWRRLAYWLKEWSLVGTCITVIFALITICVTLGIFAVSGIKENATFRGRTENRPDHIEAVLLELRASQSPRAVLNDLTKLNDKQLASALPALRKVTEQPIAKVSPSPEVLHEVTSKLRRVNENTPDYWATVLQFIQFASSGVASNAPPPGSPTGVTLNNADGIAIGPHSVVVLAGGEISNIRFEDSRIIFTRNPVQMRNLLFVGCKSPLKAAGPTGPVR